MARVKIKRWLISWSPVVLALLFIGLWVGGYLAQDIYDSLQFDGFPADGPFQLFNPLRRIADGQVPGVQFQFFHGLGVPFLHYPIFWLFGKSIFASEMSRYLTSLFCYLGSLWVFAYVVARRDWRLTLYFVALAICISEFLNLHTLAGPGNGLVVPGNSLLGVRSTLPIISFALLISRVRPRLKAILMGACLALALFFGTEHGLALLASFTLISLVILASSILAGHTSSVKESLNLRFFLIAFISAGFSIALIYLTLCGFKGGVQALRYNLVEVPKDQFWYFGVPPNDFASALGDFLHTSGKGVVLILVITAWLGVTFLTVVKSARSRSLSFYQLTTGIMLSYAILSCSSCLGILDSGYLAPMARVAILALLMTIFREGWVGRAAREIKAQSGPLKIGIPVAAALALGIGFVTVSMLAVKKLPQLNLVLSRRPAAQLSILWGKYLEQVTRAIDSRQAAEGKLTIWSTYAGLLEEHYKAFNPTDDYIIHALGPERRKHYLATFDAEKPEIVQTIRRSLFMQYANNRNYELWLRNTSWDFYESVLRNYDILTVTDRSILWQRKAGPWASPDESYDCFPAGQGSEYFDIPRQYTSSRFGIIVVKLRYHVSNPWARMPVLGALPRFFVTFEGAAADLPVSLPPYAKEAQFPVMFHQGTTPRLRFQTFSLMPGASYTVDEIQVKTIELTEKQAIFLED